MKIFLNITLVIFLALRVFLYFSILPVYPEGTKIRINAKVISEPIIYSDSQYLKLSGFKVYVPLYPRVYYGDRIVVEGIVANGKLDDPKLVLINEKKGILYQYRQKIISFYEQSLPKDHSALIAGMVIGSKGGIGEDLWNDLKKSGTAHVVVASGMNVSMVAGFLVGILIIILPRRKAIPFVLAGIWIYAVLSGFDAPIVRASVMGSTAFLAQLMGRMYQSLRILLFTAVVLIFLKPVWINDMGFWLSVLATASIVIFYPKIKKIFVFLPKIVREDWSTTLSAQIGVVPLLYYNFGQFNILSPFINVAVLWTVVPITLIGMISGIIGTIYQPLGRFLLYLCYPFTSWFLFVISGFT
jgi:competence protein ComEC